MRKRSIFFLIFALSGFSGLIYESIWTHYLKLFLGHAAYAQTLVLAIFMAGLSLGSWICSRYSVRWKNLLTGYALTEGAIGLFALFFHTVFDQAIQTSYVSVIPNLHSPLSITAFKWMLSALMILPQTILLGMTFPLMTGGIIRMFPDDSGKSISMLYFTNSFGAALGVLASGFILIRLLGLPGTVRLAGLVNVGLSVYVWLIARALAADSPESAAPQKGDQDRDAKWYWFLLATSLITGASSFIYEIGWIRMLSLVLGSSTHAFELMLAAFIFGLAFGGLWMRYRIQSIADTIRFLVIVQIIMGFLALSTLPLYGNTFVVMKSILKVLQKTDTGYALFNLSSNAIALAIMFPTTFCAGMTLPLITYSLIKRGHGERSIGAVYATNTVGAIIGVFFAVHYGMPMLGLKGLMIVGASLDIAVGVGLLWSTTAAHRSFRIPALVTALCVGVVFLTAVLIELDAYKMASGVYRFGVLHQRELAKLVFHKDGKTATVSSFLTDAGLDIRTNGKSDAQIQLNPYRFRTQDEPTMILAAAIPMALSPQAKTAANIGLGSGLTTATLLRNDAIEEVDTIEIEEAMVQGARNFGSVVGSVYTDPRSKIYIDDAKTFFSAHNRKYDIIVSEPSNPWVSGVAGLFSEEFYRLVGRHLTETGVFCQWLQLYEIDVDLVVSVLKALSSSFTDFVVYAANDQDMIIIARNGAALPEPDPAIFERPRIAGSLKRIQIETMQDLALHRIGDKRLFRDFLDALPIRANSDYYPILDQNAARARFLRADSIELIKLTYRPLPLSEVLMASPVPREHTKITPSPDFTRAYASFAAMALRDFYLTGSFGALYWDVREDIKKQAVQLKQLFFNECGSGSEERIFSLHKTVAVQMIPFLRPHEMEDVWKGLETGACVRSFTPADRQWITLLKAVGRRDAGAMASTADALLEKGQDLPEGPMEYLVATGMLGNLAQGNKEEALRLWRKHQFKMFGSRPPTLLFRFLVALSGMS